MKEWQDSIYFIAGESVEVVEKSPFLEKFKKKDVEVLYLTEPIDEYCIQNIPDYEGKKMQSITKEGLKFGDEDEKVREGGGGGSSSSSSSSSMTMGGP